MGLQKNVASQKWFVFAFDRTDNTPKTGDAANISAKIGIDFAAANATNDVAPTEIEDGFYSFDLTQAETNGDTLNLLPESSTADIQVIGVPGVIFTNPATFADLGITGGAIDDVTLVATTTTNTDVRGTDNAALASVVGALADAAAAGDPTSADTVMQYLKQLINTLEGAVGIPTFPAEAAPANNVSLAESIRAIAADVTGLAGAAMRGTDSAALATALSTAQDDLNTITDTDGVIVGDAGIDKVWDEVLTGATHNVTNSSGKRLRQIEAAFVVDSGTAQAGTASTITLASTANSVTNNIYRGDRIIITEGTGVGEHGLVVSYVASTRVATMAENWVITPDATSVYEVQPASVDIETWQHNVVTGDGDWAAAQADLDTITDTDGVILGAAGVDLIWDELIAGHVSANTFGAQCGTDIDAILVDTNSLNDTKIPDTISLANINAQVVDVIRTDTATELSAVPAASPNLHSMVQFVFMALRNKIDVTATTKEIHNDAGTIIGTKTLSDDATTYSETKAS